MVKAGTTYSLQYSQIQRIIIAHLVRNVTVNGNIKCETNRYRNSIAVTGAVVAHQSRRSVRTAHNQSNNILSTMCKKCHPTIGLLGSMKSILLVFRACGISRIPGTIDELRASAKRTLKQELKRRSFAIPAIWIVVLSIFLIRDFRGVNPYKVPKSYPMYQTMLIYSIFVLRVWSIFIIAESFAKRKSEIEFFMKIARIDAILTTKLEMNMHYDEQKRSNRIFSIKWMAINVFVACVYLVVFISRQYSKYGFFSDQMLFAFTFSCINWPLSTLSYFQYFAYARLVKFRLKLMQRIFRREDQELPLMPFVIHHERDADLGRLFVLRQLYDLVCESVTALNHLFEWGLTINVTLSFVNLISSASLILEFLFRPPEVLYTVFIFVGNLVGTALSIGRVVYLINLCHQTLDEVRSKFDAN